MEKSVVDTIYSIEDKENLLYKEYGEKRLTSCAEPVSATIKKNKLPLFGNLKQSQKSKLHEHVTSLKENCGLFSRLFIASQIRKVDLDDFFKHENQAGPPSISQGRMLRIGKKSDILQCFPGGSITELPIVEVSILDGAVVTNLLGKSNCKIFQDYSEDQFKTYISHVLSQVERVDIIWDIYIPNSLMERARRKRGQGIRRKVTPTGFMPKNWQSFLPCDENKDKLFQYLSMLITSQEIEDKLVVSNYGEIVLSNSSIRWDEMAPGNHEEADTRLLLHVAHTGKEFSSIMIKTVDSDIVVLALSVFEQLCIEKLWIEFGVGRNVTYLPVHQMVVSLTTPVCKALPFFHAFTACDTCSAFNGKGKISVYETWKILPEMTDVFIRLSNPVTNVSDDDIRKIERFVVMLYFRTCHVEYVNDARKILFSQGKQQIENFPPWGIGVENILTYDAIVERQGQGQESFIAGPFTHNQRIEQLWRDVFRFVAATFYYVFYAMEQTGLLDINQPVHMLVLHLVFTSRIKFGLKEFLEAFDAHCLSTEHSWSPGQRWINGIIDTNNPMASGDLDDISERLELYGEDLEGPCSAFNGATNNVFVSPDVILDGLEVDADIYQLIDPNRHSADVGADVYIKALDLVTQRMTHYGLTVTE
eukprot:gene2124-2410_t